MFLAQYAFRPFLNSPPIWDYWLLLIIPLCLGVAIVYKSMKVASPRQLPLEAISTMAYILGAMAAIAAAVTLLNAII